MTISATNQGLRPGVCLSTSRPSTPFDGMMIYETDTNLVRIWNGTAWKTLAYSDYTSGSVLQVVSTTKTDTFTTTSTSFVDVTGLSATITPTSTSNKVLVFGQVSYGGTNSAHVGLFKVVGGNTASYVGDSAGSRIPSIFGGFSDANQAAMLYTGNFLYLDSPSTTSATTYKVQARSATTYTCYVNRSAQDSDNANTPRAASTITVMEIAG
jgi:hypothetical protein